MTDIEIYQAAITELKAQLGAASTAKFLQHCKPNEYDYSVERHKLLANQPDIDTIAKRIQQREAELEEAVKFIVIQTILSVLLKILTLP